MPTDPRTDPLRFAYWVPNVSGGLVTSTIEQRTDWSFEYNRKLARLAERAGFEGRDVLPIVRELEVEAGLDRDAVPDPAAGLTETDHLAHVGA
jgi:hypothetical protein